ncbi:hypothetical protein [Maribellus maritimus]|uniref:hypothetical protein n=1 Tax=Maribellus maritimus TaxID=2870838 RepID=UPI001EEC2E24|nr:hypothetical protein [Maribellus maritimus]MCG6188952.1 hypothetical protein [Maribellus maritimus]
MKLADLNKDWKQDISVTYKLGLIEYQCRVKYFPFCSGNRNKYENQDLTELFTPVFHFEFETLNTKEMTYQSHWIMPYSLAWFLNSYPDSSLETMVRFAAKENGYVERISEVNQKLQRGTQLSIF